MNYQHNTQSPLRRMGNAFFVCFGSAYVLALAGIVVLYYCLPANDAAKTSWFPIILFDPFVLTVTVVFATFPAFIAFGISLLFICCDYYARNRI